MQCFRSEFAGVCTLPGRSKLALFFVLSDFCVMTACYYGGNPAIGSCTQLAVEQIWMRAKCRLLCWWLPWCSHVFCCRGATPKCRSVCTSCRPWLCAEQLADLASDCPQLGVRFFVFVAALGNTDHSEYPLVSGGIEPSKHLSGRIPPCGVSFTCVRR